MANYVEIKITEVEAGDLIQVKRENSSRFSNTYRIGEVIDIDEFLGRPQTESGILLKHGRGAIQHVSGSKYRKLIN